MTSAKPRRGKLGKGAYREALTQWYLNQSGSNLTPCADGFTKAQQLAEAQRLAELDLAAEFPTKRQFQAQRYDHWRGALSEQYADKPGNLHTVAHRLATEEANEKFKTKQMRDDEKAEAEKREKIVAQIEAGNLLRWPKSPPTPLRKQITDEFLDTFNLSRVSREGENVYAAHVKIKGKVFRLMWLPTYNDAAAVSKAARAITRLVFREFIGTDNLGVDAFTQSAAATANIQIAQRRVQGGGLQPVMAQDVVDKIAAKLKVPAPVLPAAPIAVRGGLQLGDGALLDSLCETAKAACAFERSVIQPPKREWLDDPYDKAIARAWRAFVRDNRPACNDDTAAEEVVENPFEEAEGDNLPALFPLTDDPLVDRLRSEASRWHREVTQVYAGVNKLDAEAVTAIARAARDYLKALEAYQVQTFREAAAVYDVIDIEAELDAEASREVEKAEREAALSA